MRSPTSPPARPRQATPAAATAPPGAPHSATPGHARIPVPARTPARAGPRGTSPPASARRSRRSPPTATASPPIQTRCDGPSPRRRGPVPNTSRTSLSDAAVARVLLAHRLRDCHQVVLVRYQLHRLIDRASSGATRCPAARRSSNSAISIINSIIAASVYPRPNTRPTADRVSPQGRSPSVSERRLRAGVPTAAVDKLRSVPPLSLG